MAGHAVLRVLSRVRREWKRYFPRLVLPLWVSPGLWWLARNDALGDQLFVRSFERDERAFVSKFILPGMAVVDVGANAGLYTIIAAKRVGPSVLETKPAPTQPVGLGASSAAEKKLPTEHPATAPSTKVLRSSVRSPWAAMPLRSRRLCTRRRPSIGSWV